MMSGLPNQTPDLPEALHQKKWIVFFDFDNTITSSDILDNIIARFSVNDDWKALEKLWVEEKIGSRECLEGQLKGVRIRKQALSDYLSTIMIDPFFGKLLALLRSKHIDYMITSDSFTFIIKEMLRHNGIRRIKVYANELKFRGERLVPSFPFATGDCLRCAHCKKRHVPAHADKTTVYVGDGLSDFCPARQANLVFAKDRLLDFFKKSGRPCLEFRDLKNVFDFFEDLEPFKMTSSKRILKD